MWAQRLLACSFALAIAVGISQNAVGQTAVSKDGPANQTSKPHRAPGAIGGKVVDGTTGAPVASATIKAVKSDSPHKVFETTSAADGVFHFANLEPGHWTLTVSAKGMLSLQEKVEVVSGAQSEVKFAVEDMESSEILRITGKRTLIHPERIGSTTHLDQPFLDRYKSGNSLREVINSTPGVLPDSVGNIIVRGEHNAINYELDGAVLPEAAGVLQQGQFATPRSLQSVDVDIGGYEAKDGGGPLGAVVRMRSLPIQAKPTLRIGAQLGGPISGGTPYYFSTALSQDPNSLWHKVRIESSGTFFGTKLGLQPPVRDFRRNGRFDINVLNKLEFKPNDRDTFLLTAGINESYLHLPTSALSRHAGVKLNEHDRQNYIIANYQHKFDKWLDTADFHVVNAFYSQRLTSTNVFDPNPIINGEGGSVRSAAPIANRFNYAVSLQGNVKKKIRDHHFQAGILSELRPVKTSYSAMYFNADPRTTITSLINQTEAVSTAVNEANAEATAAATTAAAEAAAADGTEPVPVGNVTAPPEQIAAVTAAAQAANPYVPYGSPISPFTNLPGNPIYTRNASTYRGFRYLQSAYFQDTWKPSNGKFLKRWTFDAGIRFDLYHGVFGNSYGLANTIATIPGVSPFNLTPFKKQTVTQAQASGRYGAAFVLTKNTVLRGSFSNIFTPPPVDIFLGPINVTEGPDPLTGILPGSPRPLRATTGKLVDVSVEQQVGPRFVMRTNAFYKTLKNFGDSGVIDNTLVYNRLTLSGQVAYGLETRLELKAARDGYGFSGFLSHTVGIAKLRGSTRITGGVWDPSLEPETTKYPDHDRRDVVQASLAYRARNGFWILPNVSFMTGLKDSRDPAIFGAHPARTKPITLVGINAGYDLPKSLRKDHKFMPIGVEVRIENVSNTVTPINLGSPYQGTRLTIPIRVISGVYWQV